MHKEIELKTCKVGVSYGNTPGLVSYHDGCALDRLNSPGIRWEMIERAVLQVATSQEGYNSGRAYYLLADSQVSFKGIAQ